MKLSNLVDLCSVIAATEPPETTPNDEGDESCGEGEDCGNKADDNLTTGTGPLF